MITAERPHHHGSTLGEVSPARSGARHVLMLDARQDTLEAEHLIALVERRVAACHITNCLSPEVCSTLAGRLLNHETRSSHAITDLDIVGVPYYLAATSDEAAGKYFANAVRFSRQLRSLAEPYGSPLDWIFGLLNDAWPAGLVNERLECGRRMSPAIVRVLCNGAGVLPHHDHLAEEVPGSARAHSLIDQFGLNLYLRMPRAGGELELYLREFLRTEYESLAQGSYGIDRSLLGQPSFVLRPQAGDLIVISSRELHAIGGGDGVGFRVTLSAFVGYRGRNQPLSIWA